MKQTLSTIAQTLKAQLPDLWAVYIFGSQIDGTANVQSDVDIAVLGPLVIEAKRLWDIAQALAKQLDSDVDLLDLRATNLVTRHHIILQAKRFDIDNQLAVNLFEVHTLSDYLSFNELREPIVSAARSRGHIYGR
jgi:predicted nucleotidyltransferase